MLTAAAGPAPARGAPARAAAAWTPCRRARPPSPPPPPAAATLTPGQRGASPRCWRIGCRTHRPRGRPVLSPAAVAAATPSSSALPERSSAAAPKTPACPPPPSISLHVVLPADATSACWCPPTALRRPEAPRRAATEAERRCLMLAVACWVSMRRGRRTGRRRRRQRTAWTTCCARWTAGTAPSCASSRRKSCEWWRHRWTAGCSRHRPGPRRRRRRCHQRWRQRWRPCRAVVMAPTEWPRVAGCPRCALVAAERSGALPRATY